MGLMEFFFSKKKRKVRSYSEAFNGERTTVGLIQSALVRAFGEEVMKTNSATIYRYKGKLYVLK